MIILYLILLKKINFYFEVKVKNNGEFYFNFKNLNFFRFNFIFSCIGFLINMGTGQYDEVRLHLCDCNNMNYSVSLVNKI